MATTKKAGKAGRKVDGPRTIAVASEVCAALYNYRTLLLEERLCRERLAIISRGAGTPSNEGQSRARLQAFSERLGALERQTPLALQKLERLASRCVLQQHRASVVSEAEFRLADISGLSRPKAYWEYDLFKQVSGGDGNSLSLRFVYLRGKAKVASLFDADEIGFHGSVKTTGYSWYDGEWWQGKERFNAIYRGLILQYTLPKMTQDSTVTWSYILAQTIPYFFDTGNGFVEVHTVCSEQTVSANPSDPLHLPDVSRYSIDEKWTRVIDDARSSPPPRSFPVKKGQTPYIYLGLTIGIGSAPHSAGIGTATSWFPPKLKLGSWSLVNPGFPISYWITPTS